MPVAIDMSLADEAKRIGQRLIPEHHSHLRDAEILYVFTSQRRKRCDRVRIGSAAKLNALQRFLSSGLETVASGHDFLILIDREEWSRLEPAQREALIDHELCHCATFVKFDGNHGIPGYEGVIGWLRWVPEMPDHDEFDEWRYGIRGHDVEEFADVLKRHGWWKSDAREKGFGEIALQLTMPTNGKGR